MKSFVVAGVALLALPSVLHAQSDKDKAKDKDDKKTMQTIVINRQGDVKTKTVIEIDGNKVKIDGKDANENKDVHVNVNTVTGARVYNRVKTGTYSRTSPDEWIIDTEGGDHFNLFNEDQNRAMLGVVTEGDDKGAEIQSVTKESAAEKIGLKKGDIITKIGDTKIESSDDVTEAVRSHKPGDKVGITYLRDGKEQKTTAELGKWKGINMNAISIPRVPQPFAQGQGFETLGNSFYFSGRPKLGLSIQDDEDGKGAKVLDVDDDSNAAKAGLQKDDIIVGIDDKEIKGTDDVTRTIRDNKEKYTFTFKINRGGKTQNVEVKMPRKLKTADL
ncbi:MAG TPA: PDZ domain-containing protein [Flavisolibacter sp.]|nr:PDZ domain-containing protein [Flavisolibacter sp.]